MDEDHRTVGQPLGFAQPMATPIGEYDSAVLTATTLDPVTPPLSFQVDGDPGPRLDQVAPAPPETRDPMQPFESRSDEQLPSEQVRDPRQPIVTESFTNQGPDFAPPTGQPVAKWAPPTGQPVAWGNRPPNQPPEFGGVGAIARPAGYPPPVQAGLPPAPSAPVWGAPTRPQAGSGYPVQVRTAPGVPTEEAQIRARYDNAADGLGKFAIVMLAIPWPVLLILLVGVLVSNGWAVLFLCLAWVICGANAKVARTWLNRCFVGAAITYTVAWLMATTSNSYTLADIYYSLARWCCAVLIVLLPLLAWRALERRR